MATNPDVDFDNSALLPRSTGLEQAIRNAVREELRGGGSGGGGLGELERRVSNLEADVKTLREVTQDIRADLAVIKSNYVTKTELSALSNEIHAAKVDLIKWTVGTLIAGMGVVAAIVFGVMRLSAAPVQISSHQAAPIAAPAAAPAQTVSPPFPALAPGAAQKP